MDAIQAANLRKTYKNGVRALDGFHISVKKGEIFSLLGENGAGKSTLIHILTTFMRMDQGNVRILGKDLSKDSAAIRSKIACVAQRTSIDIHLSLKENLLFQSRIYKVPKAEARQRMELLISAFELEQYTKYPVSSYSGGIKRRLDIALSMMSKPEILFLDEPTVGMDLPSRLAMWKMMRSIRDDFGTTIFLTTHYLEEADSLSDTICIMKDGKEIVQGTPFALRKYLKQNTLQIHFPTPRLAEEHLLLLSGNFPGRTASVRNASILFDTADSHSDLEAIAHFLTENHLPFTGIEIMQPTLEDVFLRLTAHEKQEESI